MRRGLLGAAFTSMLSARSSTVQEVKRVIDLLALYKFNALSMHLTDDQAWRIEAGRPAGYKSDSPFYTNTELRELIATPRTASSRSFPWSTPRPRQRSIQCAPSWLATQHA
jgi:hypothetical protein